MNVAGEPDGPAGAEREQRVTDGLYTLGIEMTGIKRGHATGVVVLHDGRIMGGDSFFYYTGSYSYHKGKWRGEMSCISTPTRRRGSGSISAIPRE